MRSIACLAILAPVLAACAFGNTIDYRGQTVPLAARSDKAVIVRVDDRRPSVVSGEDAPEFVGVVRTGVGLPYSVITGSARPLAEDLAMSVAQSLRSAGIRAAPAVPAAANLDPTRLLAAAGAERLLLVTLLDWKSDKAYATTVSYAVKAEVFDAAARSLGSSDVRGQQTVPGAMTVDPSEHSARGVLDVSQRVLRQLLDQPQIVAALR